MYSVDNVPDHGNEHPFHYCTVEAWSAGRQAGVHWIIDAPECNSLGGVTVAAAPAQEMHARPSQPISANCSGGSGGDLRRLNPVDIKLVLPVDVLYQFVTLIDISLSCQYFVKL